MQRPPMPPSSFKLSLLRPIFYFFVFGSVLMCPNTAQAARPTFENTVLQLQEWSSAAGTALHGLELISSNVTLEVKKNEVLHCSNSYFQQRLIIEMSAYCSRLQDVQASFDQLNYFSTSPVGYERLLEESRSLNWTEATKVFDGLDSAFRSFDRDAATISTVWTLINGITTEHLFRPNPSLLKVGVRYLGFNLTPKQCERVSHTISQAKDGSGLVFAVVSGVIVLLWALQYMQRQPQNQVVEQGIPAPVIQGAMPAAVEGQHADLMAPQQKCMWIRRVLQSTTLLTIGHLLLSGASMLSSPNSLVLLGVPAAFTAAGCLMPESVSCAGKLTDEMEALQAGMAYFESARKEMESRFNLLYTTLTQITSDRSARQSWNISLQLIDAMSPPPLPHLLSLVHHISKERDSLRNKATLIARSGKHDSKDADKLINNSELASAAVVNASLALRLHVRQLERVVWPLREATMQLSYCLVESTDLKSFRLQEQTFVSVLKNLSRSTGSVTQQFKTMKEHLETSLTEINRQIDQATVKQNRGWMFKSGGAAFAIVSAVGGTVAIAVGATCPPAAIAALVVAGVSVSIYGDYTMEQALQVKNELEEHKHHLMQLCTLGEEQQKHINDIANSWRHFGDAYITVHNIADRLPLEVPVLSAVDKDLVRAWETRALELVRKIEIATGKLHAITPDYVSSIELE